MRIENTVFGQRVHYSAEDVPSVIAEAHEMFWAPFWGWAAWLECGRSPGDPFELEFRVRQRAVFRGVDHDVERLLAVFQAFLDANIDRLDVPSFVCREHTPIGRS